MIRISTTTLESYRRLIETPYGNENLLLLSIKGKDVAGWQAHAGRALHAIVENPTGYTISQMLDVPVIEYHGFAYTQAVIDRILHEMGPGVPEVKATRTFYVDGRPVSVVAKADRVDGLMITDLKAKFSQVDHQATEHDLQWRFYLLVHGAAMFRYLFAQFIDQDKPKDGEHFRLKEISQVRYYPYEGLERDCRHWLTQFLSWAESKKLLPYLEREGSSLTAEVL